MDESINMSEVVAALESAYAAIRENHGEVPPAIIVVGPSRDPRGLVLGHWAKTSWQAGEERAHELFVTAEWLERPAEEIFGTVLHEAAHALATARGVVDCVRQRHNGHFKAMAIELGMDCVKHSQPSRGWASTTPRPETLELYAPAVERIRAAVKAYRAPLRVKRDPDKAAKAKISSAKSMVRWLATAEPAVMVDLLNELTESGAIKLECPSCGESGWSL